MTSQEAIEIVNNLIILNKDEFYPDELEAFEKLIHDAKNWNEMVNNIPHCIDYKSHSCEEIGEGLYKVADSIGGHGGYIVSAEDMHTALERE